MESKNAAPNKIKAYGVRDGVSKLRIALNTPNPPESAENTQRVANIGVWPLKFSQWGPSNAKIEEKLYKIEG
jgi:hypothetical protein